MSIARAVPFIILLALVVAGSVYVTYQRDIGQAASSSTWWLERVRQY
jgi:ABC-type methionine transport system permease subunit